MPFWRTYYHIVWATKRRRPLLGKDVESALYSYLRWKAHELQMQVYAINGWQDHVHLVVSIPPKHSVAYVVKKLKGSSSHHINQLAIVDEQFGWQRGYGVLTVGERHRETAVSYVEGQKEHHHQQTTNAWLERIDEYDDGPPDMSFGDDPAGLSYVREIELEYVTSGSDGIPF